LDNFLSKIDIKFKFNLWIHRNINENFVLRRAKIFIANSLSQHDEIEFFYITKSPYTAPLKSLFFFTNQKFEDLKYYFEEAYSSRLLHLLWQRAFFFRFFVTNDHDFVTLSTAEWFMRRCNSGSFEILNTFDKNSSKWMKKLENYEKFMNFNGCELVMALPQPQITITYQWGYVKVYENLTGFNVYGVTPEIFKIAAQNFNFVAAYQPINIFDPNFMSLPYAGKFELIEINESVKKIHLMFEFLPIQAIGSQGIQIVQTVIDLRSKLLFTSPEEFSPYEKVLMFFDHITWILLSAVFVFIFLIAMVAHGLSKKIRQNFKCHSQRIFWMLLFIFCIILQILLQSKYFEFKSTKMLKPEIAKTLNDLFAQNYTFFESPELKFENKGYVNF